MVLLSDEAKTQYAQLANDQGCNKRFKAVRKALAYLQLNPRHPSLNTHKFTSLQGRVLLHKG